MRKKSIHDGHRKRVKEEFHTLGLEHFPPHKVLEMLLFYTIPQGDTNATGHELIERFGSVAGVLDAPVELLKKVPGIGPQSAIHIRFVGSLIRKYMESQIVPPKIIRTAEHAKDFVRHKFTGESAECGYLVCLGSSGKVIYCENISKGSGKRVEITPAKIARTCLLCDAVKAIIAHNHPHGICVPSREDLHTTKILYDHLMRVDVELMDHIIVAPDGVFSMSEGDMLPR